jgi:hypothetical protein
MRKIWILLPLLVVASCMSKEPTKTSKRTLKREVKDSLHNYSFESLIEGKFKEFYDLNVLLKEYPKFKNDIEQRMESFASGRHTIFHIHDSIKVVNIRQKGPFVKVSDSTETTHVLFDIITNTKSTTDSVMAFITKKKAQLDNKEVTSTKVKFREFVMAEL